MFAALAALVTSLQLLLGAAPTLPASQDVPNGWDASQSDAFMDSWPADYWTAPKTCQPVQETLTQSQVAYLRASGWTWDTNGWWPYGC